MSLEFNYPKWTPDYFLSNPMLLWQFPKLPVDFFSLLNEARLKCDETQNTTATHYGSQPKSDWIGSLLKQIVKSFMVLLAIPLMSLALVNSLVSAIAIAASYLLNTIWTLLLIPCILISRGSSFLTNIITLPGNLIFYALAAINILALGSLFIASLIPAIVLSPVIWLAEKILYLPYRILKGIFYDLPMSLAQSVTSAWKSYWRTFPKDDDELAEKLKVLQPFLVQQKKSEDAFKKIVRPISLLRYSSTEIPTDIIKNILSFVVRFPSQEEITSKIVQIARPLAGDKSIKFLEKIRNELKTTACHRKVNFGPAYCIPSHTRREWHNTQLRKYEIARHRLLNPPPPQGSTPSATSSSTAGRQRRTG